MRHRGGPSRGKFGCCRASTCWTRRKRALRAPTLAAAPLIEGRYLRCFYDNARHETKEAYAGDLAAAPDSGHSGKHGAGDCREASPASRA